MDVPPRGKAHPLARARAPPQGRPARPARRVRDHAALWTLQYHRLLSKRFPYAARRIGQGENMTISLTDPFKEGRAHVGTLDDLRRDLDKQS
jgi:hypothetical protein